MNIDLEHWQDVAVTFGLKALGALIVWIVGRWLISMATNLMTAALKRKNVDPTLTRYLGSIVGVSLNVILVVAILGYFGVETTSFAALVAGVGIAVGAAWGGLLSTRCGCVSSYCDRSRSAVHLGRRRGGTVKELGPPGPPDPRQRPHDHRQCEDFRRQHQNYSANPYRRVDLRPSSRTALIWPTP
jgi:small conductance mechanosensitive channel